MSDALMYAVGGLIAAEATGVTNFSGGGGGSSSGGGGGSGLIPGLDQINTMSARIDQLQQALAQADEVADAGTEIIKIGGETTERIREIVRVPTNMGGDDTTTTDTTDTTDTTGQTGPTPSPNSGPGGNKPGYQFQEDYQGPGSELVAGGAEFLHQTGQLTNDGINAAKGSYDFLSGIESDGWNDLESLANGNYTPDEGSVVQRVDSSSKIDEAIARQTDNKKGGGIFDIGPIFGGKQQQKDKDTSSRPTVTTNPDNQPDSTNKSQQRKQQRKDKGKTNTTGSTPFDKPLVPTGSPNWSL